MKSALCSLLAVALALPLPLSGEVFIDDFSQPELKDRLAERGDWKFANNVARCVADPELYKKFRNHGPILKWPREFTDGMVSFEMKPQKCQRVVFTFNGDGHIFRVTLADESPTAPAGASKVPTRLIGWRTKSSKENKGDTILPDGLPDLPAINGKWSRVSLAVNGKRGVLTIGDFSTAIEHVSLARSKTMIMLSFAHGELAVRDFRFSGGPEASTGIEEETATLNVVSSFPFVDRSRFLERGTIAYRVPEQQADGIPVGDARKLGANLGGILKLLNQIERQNQDFKVGKGPARKKGGDPRGPKVQGCIDSVLIAKDGKLVLEEYFADARPDRPHYQMSITKSIQAYAIGKAIETGAIKSENDLLLDYLPEVDRSQVADGVESLRLVDLLTMSSGIRFKTPAKKPEITRHNHARLYLSHTAPVPAKRDYKYDGTNNDLLSHVLFNATGKTLGEYAGKHLFAPLGITDFSFGPSLCGLDKAAAGMRLRSRDMLKIGLLTASGGAWHGKQILNREWIEKATAVHVNQGQPHHYGYFWWSNDIEVKGRTYRLRSCRGAGGQFILVQPELGLVAVFTSYYAKNRPLQHFEKIIAPAFVK